MPAVIKLSGTEPATDIVVPLKNLPKYEGIVSDWSNIRFRAMDGSVVPHWVEHKGTEPTGTIWIRLPQIDENGTVLFMEWGDWNNGFGDGKQVFDVFDDFETAPPSETDGVFTVVDDTFLDVADFGTVSRWHGPRTSYTLSSPLQDYMVHYCVRYTAESYPLIAHVVWMCNEDNINNVLLFADLHAGIVEGVLALREDGDYDLNATTLWSTKGWTDGIWIFSMKRTGSTLQAFADGVLQASVTTNYTDPITKVKVGILQYSTYPPPSVHRIDWVAAYRIPSVEPQIADVQYIENELDSFYYWIEHDETGAPKNYVWVKVPYIPAGRSVTVYAQKIDGYSPDGEKTFELFDDFDTLDTSKWTTYGNCAVSDGMLTLTPNTNSNNAAALQSSKTFTNNVSVETHLIPQSNTYFDLGLVTNTPLQTNTWHLHEAANYGHFLEAQDRSSYTEYLLVTKANTTTLRPFSADSYIANVIYRLQFKDDGTLIGQVYDQSRTLKGENSATTSAYLTDEKHVVIWQGYYQPYSLGGPLQVDWIFVRKLAYSEPTISVQAQSDYYEIIVTNNTSQDLYDYQIQVPIELLPVTSPADSLQFTFFFSSLSEPSESGQSEPFAHNIVLVGSAQSFSYLLEIKSVSVTQKQKRYLTVVDITGDVDGLEVLDVTSQIVVERSKKYATYAGVAGDITPIRILEFTFSMFHAEEEEIPQPSEYQYIETQPTVADIDAITLVPAVKETVKFMDGYALGGKPFKQVFRDGYTLLGVDAQALNLTSITQLINLSPAELTMFAKWLVSILTKAEISEIQIHQILHNTPIAVKRGEVIRGFVAVTNLDAQSFINQTSQAQWQAVITEHTQKGEAKTKTNLFFRYAANNVVVLVTDAFYNNQVVLKTVPHEQHFEAFNDIISLFTQGVFSNALRAITSDAVYTLPLWDLVEPLVQKWYAYSFVKPKTTLTFLWRALFKVLKATERKEAISLGTAARVVALLRDIDSGRTLHNLSTSEAFWNWHIAKEIIYKFADSRKGFAQAVTISDTAERSTTGLRIVPVERTQKINAADHSVCGALLTGVFQTYTVAKTVETLFESRNAQKFAYGVVLTGDFQMGVSGFASYIELEMEARCIAYYFTYIILGPRSLCDQPARGYRSFTVKHDRRYSKYAIHLKPDRMSFAWKMVVKIPENFSIPSKDVAKVVLKTSNSLPYLSMKRLVLPTQNPPFDIVVRAGFKVFPHIYPANPS